MGTKKEYKEALEGMVNQFAYTSNKDGRACIHTGGLSALEFAFDVLGLKDPQPVPERECEWDDGGKYGKCHKLATSGMNTPDGYKRLCFDHVRKLNEVQK